MINANQLIEIGRFNQPHGIKGEINATIDEGIDLTDLRCIVVDVDGIFVPFFIASERSRSATTRLITLEDVADEKQATDFQGKTIYGLKEEISDIDDDETDDEGFYADDLIGFNVFDKASGMTGQITDYDDSTENLLFIVETADGKNLLIPMAEEYIEQIDPTNETITFNLPDGLIDQ